MPGAYAARGRFSDRASNTSPAIWSSEHREQLLILGGLLLAGALGVALTRRSLPGTGQMTPTTLVSPRPPRLGVVLVGVGASLLAAAVCGRALAPRRQPTRGRRAARRIRDGAAILGASVLADSAIEHFRGGYHNPAMYAAPATAAVAIAASLAEPRQKHALPRIGHALSLAVGIAGLAFHAYNIGKRPGGFCWNNLFYAAPFGAPGALVLAGLLGLASEAAAALPRGRHGRMRSSRRRAARSPRWWALRCSPRRPRSGCCTCAARITIPACTCRSRCRRQPGSCCWARPWRPMPRRRRMLRQTLQATNALGVIGTGFHIYGVQRHMGGWANWRQAAVAGPPTPAPISFAGLGLAGLAALDLIEHRGPER